MNKNDMVIKFISAMVDNDTESAKKALSEYITFRAQEKIAESQLRWGDYFDNDLEAGSDTEETDEYAWLNGVEIETKDDDLVIRCINAIPNNTLLMMLRKINVDTFAMGRDDLSAHVFAAWKENKIPKDDILGYAR